MKSAPLEGEISETIVLRIASASGHLDLDGVPGVIKGSGQIVVKMHDKRGGVPPEPVVVNSSSGICSR
jgi:hypothetical protein